jgi:hypothetical protein
MYQKCYRKETCDILSVHSNNKIHHVTNINWTAPRVLNVTLPRHRGTSLALPPAFNLLCAPGNTDILHHDLEISCYLRGAREPFALLGCYSDYIDSYSPTFRDDLSVLSLRSSSQRRKFDPWGWNWQAVSKRRRYPRPQGLEQFLYLLIVTFCWCLVQIQ